MRRILTHHTSTRLLSSLTHPHAQQNPKQELIVIMGATGTGKSKLSVDIATRLRPSEIINSDKIQLYSGLDITTNKMPAADRRGVPHHLLGSVPASSGELPSSSFRSLASSLISSLSSVPILAGGSNSLIHSLVSSPNGGIGHPLSYRCCFIWVDVGRPVLDPYLDRRVDEMLSSGMVEELDGYFGEKDWAANVGLNQAIGVPEFEGYFEGKWSYEEAVAMIKRNTRLLAETQVGKIRRLGELPGWELRRVDATATVRAKMEGSGPQAEEERWGRDVLGPAMRAVEEFLRE